MTLFDEAYEAQLQLLDIFKISPTPQQQREADDILRRLISNTIDAVLEAEDED